MQNKYQKTMYACFTGYVVQAIVNNFVPLLFLQCHLVKHRTFKLLAKSCFVQRNIC